MRSQLGKRRLSRGGRLGVAYRGIGIGEELSKKRGTGAGRDGGFGRVK